MTWTLVAAGRSDRLARGDQSTIDACRATVFHGPLPPARSGVATLWLAGHDYCGYAGWARLPVGDVVVLRSSAGNLVRYRVIDRVRIGRQGGPSAGLIHSDLVLQTCSGPGTSFTYATRIR